jgi:hypothetical protein
MHTSAGVKTLNLKGVPEEVMRGLHMVAARKGVTIRALAITSLYALCDLELNDCPEWRYQTRRGQEEEQFIKRRWRT